jgi:hypothetical protein
LTVTQSSGFLPDSICLPLAAPIILESNIQMLEKLVFFARGAIRYPAIIFWVAVFSLPTGLIASGALYYINRRGQSLPFPSVEFLLVDGQRNSPLRNCCFLSAAAVAVLGHFSFRYYSRARGKNSRAAAVVWTTRTAIAVSTAICALSLLGCVLVRFDEHPSAHIALRVSYHISLFSYHISLDVLACWTKRSLRTSLGLTAVVGIVQVACAALTACALRQAALVAEALALVGLHFKFAFAGLLLVGPTFLPGMATARRADADRLRRSAWASDSWA